MQQVTWTYLKINYLPFEGEGKGGGEISGMAETQPPSQPRLWLLRRSTDSIHGVVPPARGKEWLQIFPSTKPENNFETGSKQFNITL